MHVSFLSLAFIYHPIRFLSFFSVLFDVSIGKNEICADMYLYIHADARENVRMFGEIIFSFFRSCFFSIGLNEV